MMGPDPGQPHRSPFLDDPGPPLRSDAFTLAVRILRSGARPRPSWLPVLLIALIVLIPFDGKLSGTGIIVFVAALVLEDLLRLAAAHLLECPAEGLFFLPFFRVNLTAPPGPRQAWKEALVILSGPVLSMVLVLGAALQLSIRRYVGGEALLTVLMLNVFWLLPFGGLSGSRVLNLVIFARWRISEMIFLFLTALALAGVGLLLRSWLLGVFGVLGVLGAYRRIGFRRAVAELRDGEPLPSPIESLNDAQMYRLYHFARSVVPRPPRPGEGEDPSRAGLYAGTMRQLHADATLVFPSVGVSALILFLYVAAFALAGVAFLFVPH